MDTAAAARPTFTATWHPNHGPVETLAQAVARNLRGVRAAYQANFGG